jgi:NADH:ubiquinone oxidoreductase subunit 4 (subunit M)
VSLKKSQSFYGLAQDFPLLATLFCLFGFCLIGVPLLASFVAEDLVNSGLLEQQPYLGLGHIFAGCLNGILFFLLFTKLFLGTNPSRGKVHKMDLSLGEMFPYLISLIIMFLCGVMPFLFLEKINW